MKHAFTLIELLIVVAIIGILAAIAVPSFLEAQARAKVGRELSDLRTLGGVLEVYAVDFGTYPPHGEVLASGFVQFPAIAAGITTIEFAPPRPLTTPVAYMTTLPEDPFLTRETDYLLRGYGYIQSEQMAAILASRGFASAVRVEPAYGKWRLYAAGPDTDKGRDMKLGILYDPTNGTTSNGDIVRSQKRPVEDVSSDE